MTCVSALRREASCNPFPLALPDCEREAGFRAVKRQFFFEHSDGARLIELKLRERRDIALPAPTGAAEPRDPDAAIVAVSMLVATYVAMEPHARPGFRLALIDPPEIGAYLRVLVDLAEAGVLARAHVVAYRQRSSGPRPREELAIDRRLTFEVRETAAGELGPSEDEPFHLAVVFDRARERALDRLLDHVSWIALAGRDVDRDVRLGALRISTTTDGERDVAAFARSAAAFRRPLREVARGFNAFVGSEQIDDLLTEVSDLLDEGLLGLRPEHGGKTNQHRIKGLIATVIAARWFRQAGEPRTRLLVSLDGARPWLDLGDDAPRADLVGFEWRDDRCIVGVIAVEGRDSAYEIADGVVAGSAIERMLATRRRLSAVLDGAGELLTTHARREVLRERLRRELTKASHTPAERELWEDRVRRLVEGRVEVELSCHLISVTLGGGASTLRDRTVVARDGPASVTTRVTVLNEELVEALKPRPPSDTPAYKSYAGSATRRIRPVGPVRPPLSRTQPE